MFQETIPMSSHSSVFFYDTKVDNIKFRYATRDQILCARRISEITFIFAQDQKIKKPNTL